MIYYIGVSHPGRPPLNLSAKERIRAAAIHLFAEKGFGQTTTREICRRAAVTAPVLYHHFSNKQSLYQEVVMDTLNDYRKAMVEASEDRAGLREKLVRILTSEFEITRKRPRFVTLIFRMIFAPESGQPALDYIGHGEQEHRFLTRILEEARRQGEITGEPEEIASLLMGMKMFYTLAYLCANDSQLDRRVAERIVHYLLEGCRANRGASKREK